MTDNAVEERVKLFAAGALAALTDERRAECELLSDLERGLRLRPCEGDPDLAELLWAGAVIGVTTWAWLTDGVSPPAVGDGGYHDQ